MQNNTFNGKIKKIDRKDTKTGKQYFVIDVENRYSEWDSIKKQKIDKVWVVTFNLFGYHAKEFVHDIGDFITLNFELRTEEYNWKNYIKVIVTDVHPLQKSKSEAQKAQSVFSEETARADDIQF